MYCVVTPYDQQGSIARATSMFNVLIPVREISSCATNLHIIQDHFPDT